MGQKPRVCSSYFFEMEDGSRIEVRRELLRTVYYKPYAEQVRIYE